MRIPHCSASAFGSVIWNLPVTFAMISMMAFIKDTVKDWSLTMRHTGGFMSSRFGRDAIMVALGACLAAGASAAGAVQAPRTFVSPNGGSELKVLLDKENFGGSELDIGELTLPAGLDSGEHAHQSVEIFYVLSGELEHVVNGKSELLKPGMVGFVRPPDNVRHRVPGTTPVKTLVIWTPGGEAARVAGRWKPKQ